MSSQAGGGVMVVVVVVGGGTGRVWARVKLLSVTGGKVHFAGVSW